MENLLYHTPPPQEAFHRPPATVQPWKPSRSICWRAKCDKQEEGGEGGGPVELRLCPKWGRNGRRVRGIHFAAPTFFCPS